LVHRLVWSIYGTEALDPQLHIDHIDGDPSNNHIDNLRQVSAKANALNPVTRDRMLASCAIVTPSLVRRLRSHYWKSLQSGSVPARSELCSRFKISEYNLEAILYRKSWASVPDIDPATPSRLTRNLRTAGQVV
jgi:hypothetical protein